MPVYIARFGASGPVKIGSSLSVQSRLDALQAPLWDTLHLLRLLHGTAEDERVLHRRFNRLRIRNEWFHYSDEMMGDLGLPDLHADPSRALIKFAARSSSVLSVERSAALRGWMLAEGHDERDVARLLGCNRATVEEWLRYGGRPRQAVALRLIALSGGTLETAFGPREPRYNFGQRRPQLRVAA